MDGKKHKCAGRNAQGDEGSVHACMITCAEELVRRLPTPHSMRRSNMIVARGPLHFAACK